MLSFYPGPSKIYPQIRQFLVQAYDLGILERNHRSEEFMVFCQKTILLFKEKMAIPNDYLVVFTSSATESWEIIAQSFGRAGSLHFSNGAFGNKWAEYTQKITQKAQLIEFGLEESPNFDQIKPENSLVCLTHCETSNGCFIQNFPQLTENQLLAIDATSSLGGINIDWQKSDIVFASVQKCLGLPSGLAVMVFSPKAIQIGRQIAENQHYNSFLFLEKNFLNFQTPYTPNILGIFLLQKVMEIVPKIEQTAQKLVERKQMYESFFEKYAHLQFLCKTPIFRSPTVLCLEGNAVFIEKIKDLALKKGILLGNGYGTWQKNTLRIANFPSHTEEELTILLKTLQNL